MNRFLIRLNIWLLFGLLVIGVSGCAPSFDRKEMIRDITDGIIVPNHQLFADTADQLQRATAVYVTDPSDAHLQAVQDAWHATNLAWMGCATHRYGPIRESLIINRIDSRPPRVSFIEDRIAADSVIDATFIENIGSSSQGLSAIEYLIFDPLSTADLPHNPRRLAYLDHATVIFAQNAQVLLDQWTADGMNYSQTFIDADLEGGEIQGSMNMLVNQILHDVEDITWDRLGTPLWHPTDGAIDPALLEAPYSQSSLARMEATVQHLHQLYTAGDGVGLDEYLDFLDAEYEGQPLSQVIEAQFVATEEAIQAIDEPLGLAIENDRVPVETLYDELAILITLIKVDMINHLGVTITFNDNDGD